MIKHEITDRIYDKYSQDSEIDKNRFWQMVNQICTESNSSGCSVQPMVRLYNKPTLKFKMKKEMCLENLRLMYLGNREFSGMRSIEIYCENEDIDDYFTNLQKRMSTGIAVNIDITLRVCDNKK